MLYPELTPRPTSADAVVQAVAGSALEMNPMRTRIISVCSQVAELSVFFAAAAVLAIGLMGLR